MDTPPDATISRSSAGGRGAIAAARLSGRDALALLLQIFEPAGGDSAPLGQGRVGYGVFRDGDGAVIDDGVVVPLPTSGGFVLTVHGNPLLLQRLVDRCVDLGAREGRDNVSGWLESGAQGVRREALDRLPLARTSGAVGFLLEQGSTGLAGWAAGCPDAGEIDEVLGLGKRGRGLFEPCLVVIAGVPNAGKSTLFNRLLGRDRVVTHEEPGTTRDLIEEEALFRDYPIRLVDGAGLRETDLEVEAEGVRRVRRVIAEADLVIHLEPTAAGMGKGPEGRERAGLAALRPTGLTLQFRSRADQIGAACDPVSPAVTGVAGVSGLTGEGVPRLVDSVLSALFGDPETPRGQPVPFLARHETVLREALEAAREGGDPRPILNRLLTESDEANG